VVYGAAEPRESARELVLQPETNCRGRHVIEQNLSVAEAVAGRHLEPRPVDFPRDPRRKERIAARLSARRISQFVILNPGAGWGAKQWPAGTIWPGGSQPGRRWHTPDSQLWSRRKRFGSSAASASGGAAEAIQCFVERTHSFDAAGALVYRGDTGPMHLAAALGIPVVALFGPTDPDRNGPYRTRSVVLRNLRVLPLMSAERDRMKACWPLVFDAVVAAARELLAAS